MLQLGGGLFGRHNFGLVNDGFRDRGFRLLSFDARGYGASSCPREAYTIEGWAADAAALLDAVGLDRALVHGTSMGGMIAIAFTAHHPERTIAACADVAFAKPDLYRRTVFRVWRRMAEEMAWDEFSDHVTTQAVGAGFMESPEGENIFQLVRDIVGLNDPYTVRQACLAMENMDLSPLVPKIERPLLMTNGTHDVLCPPDLAPSGLGARQDGRAERAHRAGRVPRHRPRRPGRVPAGRDPHRRRLLRPRARRLSLYFSGFVPAIQMITRLNFPSASMSKKLQLCMSFFVPSFSSPM